MTQCVHPEIFGLSWSWACTNFPGYADDYRPSFKWGGERGTTPECGVEPVAPSLDLLCVCKRDGTERKEEGARRPKMGHLRSVLHSGLGRGRGPRGW